MPYTPALSYYLGPAAVYSSPTGMTDVNTGVPYLGGTLHEGDYVDATTSEIAQWNVRFGLSLNTGRYRLVRLSPNATAGNIKVGQPVGYGLPLTISQATITAAGTGSGTGTVLCSSTASGGTAATILVTVAAGVITGVQVVYKGANFTSVPTFALTEIATAGITTSGTVNALMDVSPNFVSSFDSSCIDVTSVRGIALTTVTSAQVTANSWIVIQEQGIAPLLVTTATATAAGSVAAAASGGAVTTTTAATAPVAGFIGYTVDLAAASTSIRVELDLPVRQG